MVETAKKQPPLKERLQIEHRSISCLFIQNYLVRQLAY